MFLLRALSFFAAVLLLAGCVDITGPSTANLRPLPPAKTSPYARVGYVFCIRGWLGIWSRGMDEVGQRAAAELGVHASVLGNPEQTKLVNYIKAEHAAGRWSGPLVLVGHSIGADSQIRVAQRLHEAGITVDLLVLVDPTIPPTIPPNVRRCVNLYKSHPGFDTLPVFRGVKVQAADPRRTLLENINLRTAPLKFDSGVVNHFNIALVRGVQDMVLAEIAKTCPRKTTR